MVLVLVFPLSGALSVNLPWRSRTRAGVEHRAVLPTNGMNRSSFVGSMTQLAAAAVVPSGVFPTRSWADAGGFQDIVAGDGSFSFQCPERFEQFSKLLKTHNYEMNVKSTSQRGYVAGVAVDPVSLPSIDCRGPARSALPPLVPPVLGEPRVLGEVWNSEKGRGGRGQRGA